MLQVVEDDDLGNERALKSGRLYKMREVVHWHEVGGRRKKARIPRLMTGAQTFEDYKSLINYFQL